jgi:hypothetical protein
MCSRSKNLASCGGPYEEAFRLRVRRLHNLAFHPRVLAIARSSLGVDNARHWGLRDNPSFASGILVREIQHPAKRHSVRILGERIPLVTVARCSPVGLSAFGQTYAGIEA